MSEEVTVYVRDSKAEAYVSARDARAAGLNPNRCRRCRVPRGVQSFIIADDYNDDEFISTDWEATVRWAHDRLDLCITFVRIVWPEANEGKAQNVLQFPAPSNGEPDPI